MQEYNEKRDYVRINIDCDIIYKIVGSTVKKTGHCTDLSGGGISFSSECAYNPGLAMEIKVLPKNSITLSLTAFVEVVRSQKQADNSFKIAAITKGLSHNKDPKIGKT